MSKSDRYESFVHDISLEVANRATIRDQQKKEIERLTQTLTNLRKHQVFLSCSCSLHCAHSFSVTLDQAYVKEQISQYQEYLQQCREQHYRPTSAKIKTGKKSKKSDKSIAGPFKFSYKDLSKQVAKPDVTQRSAVKKKIDHSPRSVWQGVIVDSDVPQLSRKKTQFLISSEEVGIFDIVAKIAGISVEKVLLLCSSPPPRLIAFSSPDDSRTR